MSNSPRDETSQDAPQGWFLQRLDGFLSEPLRRASPLELSKARVVAGTSLILLPIGVLFVLFSILKLPNPWLVGAAAVVIVIMLLGALMLLRRASSARPSALLLCLTMGLSFLPSTLPMNEPYAGAHPSAMLLPLLAVYLLGGRIGLAFTAATCLSMFAFPLYYRDAVTDFPRYLGIYTFAALSILGGWALGRLHGLASDEAQTALEHTMKDLRVSERQMSSLIESTGDMVLSVDAKGHLLVINQPAIQSFQERFGKEGIRRGDSFFNLLPPHRQQVWRNRLDQVLHGQRLEIEDVVPASTGTKVLSTSLHPIIGDNGQPVGATLFTRDITARREAEAKLTQLHRSMIDVSRQAGMAEMAAGVLHNVGNTLNSVNISAALLGERLRTSRVVRLARATRLMREHAGDLAAFLTSDTRGRRLPPYLFALSDELLQEQQGSLKDLELLIESIDHVKSIVSMQQATARMAGLEERLQVPQLIDDALRLIGDSFERLSIQVRREYEEVQDVVLDRHKLLQILVNLLSNARHALRDSGREDKVLTIRVRQEAEAKGLRVDISDNGVGIPPENLTRIFSQGFTTKKSGHGFGLHISALAAKELGGTLTCQSGGLGQGATFSLELPVEERRA
jgi:PAS domain S-box-containing protein